MKNLILGSPMLTHFSEHSHSTNCYNDCTNRYNDYTSCYNDSTNRYNDSTKGYNDSTNGYNRLNKLAQLSPFIGFFRLSGFVAIEYGLHLREIK
jgi:hypothetical protein